MRKSMLNSVILEGILTRKPVSLQNACSFSIDTFRYPDSDAVDPEISSFNVEARGKLEEICLEYLAEGRAVRIVGRLKTKNVGEEDRVIIIADHIEFRQKEEFYV